MNIEVQIQIFGARNSKFSFFKKFHGAQILIFFYGNWLGASFYIKEQMQKYKFEREWDMFDNWVVIFQVCAANALLNLESIFLA